MVKYELPRIHVKGGESAEIYTDPVSPGGQVWPVGLEVDPDVAPLLMVNDLKVGRNSQLFSCGSVPATLFAALLPGQRFSLRVICSEFYGSVLFRGRLLAASPASKVPGKTSVVGFGYTGVGAGQTVEVVASPQVDFRLRRLHVAPHLLGVFSVDALFQGKYLDVAQASRVADVRQLDRENLSRGGEVGLEPYAVVGAGQPVTAVVTNTSGSLQYFSAALLGEQVARSRA
jgi:hypothetical protein